MTDTAVTYLVAIFMGTVGVCLIACSTPNIIFPDGRRECLLGGVTLTLGLACVAGSSWIIDTL